MSAKNLIMENQAKLSFEPFNIATLCMFHICIVILELKLLSLLELILIRESQLSSKAYLTLSAIAEKVGVSTGL